MDRIYITNYRQAVTLVQSSSTPLLTAVCCNAKLKQKPMTGGLALFASGAEQVKDQMVVRQRMS